MVRNVFRLDDRQIGSMMMPAHRDHLARRQRPAGHDAGADGGQPATRATRCAAAASTTCSAVVVGPEPAARRWRAASATDLAALLTRAGLRARNAVRHGAARAVPRLQCRAGVRRRRVRRSAGRDHRARRARGHHRRVLGAWRTTTPGPSRATDGSWLLDGLIPVPELKDRLEPEGAARGRPRPLQHAGWHDHALARPPAAHCRSRGLEWLAIRSRRPRRQAGRQSARGADRQSRRKPVMINPNLYAEPQALDRIQHRTTQAPSRWHPLRPLGGQLNAIFIAAVEFGDVCREYPIIFVECRPRRRRPRARWRRSPCWASSKART